MLTFWAALGIAFAVSASAIGIELEENAPWNNGTGSNDEQINLQISTRGPGRNQTSPLLYGWMIEDISVSSIPGVPRLVLTLGNSIRLKVASMLNCYPIVPSKVCSSIA